MRVLFLLAILKRIMRKIGLLLLTVLFATSCSSQKKITTINQKLASKRGKEIVFVKLVSDSRCPEKTECIWAGEVTVEVAAYIDKQLVERKQFTFNQANETEIINWFVRHLPETSEKLKTVSVMPYLKNGISVKYEDFYISLEY